MNAFPLDSKVFSGSSGGGEGYRIYTLLFMSKIPLFMYKHLYYWIKYYALGIMCKCLLAFIPKREPVRWICQERRWKSPPAQLKGPYFFLPTYFE